MSGAIRRSRSGPLLLDRLDVEAQARQRFGEKLEVVVADRRRRDRRSCAICSSHSPSRRSASSSPSMRSAPRICALSLASVARSARLLLSRKNASSTCSMWRRLTWISRPTCASSTRSCARLLISSSIGAPVAGGERPRRARHRAAPASRRPASGSRARQVSSSSRTRSRRAAAPSRTPSRPARTRPEAGILSRRSTSAAVSFISAPLWISAALRVHRRQRLLELRQVLRAARRGLEPRVLRAARAARALRAGSAAGARRPRQHLRGRNEPDEPERALHRLHLRRRPARRSRRSTALRAAAGRRPSRCPRPRGESAGRCARRAASRRSPASRPPSTRPSNIAPTVHQNARRLPCVVTSSMPAIASRIVARAALVAAQPGEQAALIQAALLDEMRRQAVGRDRLRAARCAARAATGRDRRDRSAPRPSRRAPTASPRIRDRA